MATLYVENIPDELYDALKRRARENRKSIAAEVLVLLEENVPTEMELKRRRNVQTQAESTVQLPILGLTNLAVIQVNVSNIYMRTR